MGRKPDPARLAAAPYGRPHILPGRLVPGKWVSPAAEPDPLASCRARFYNLLAPLMNIERRYEIGAQQRTPKDSAHYDHSQSLLRCRALSPPERRWQHAQHRRQGCERDWTKAYAHRFADCILNRHARGFISAGAVEQHDPMVQADADQRQKSDQSYGIQSHAAHDQCDCAAAKGQRNLQQQQSRNETTLELE